MTLGPVFLSYKRAREAHAAQLADALTADGFEVWWDIDLRASESWADQIDSQIDRAKAVIVLWDSVTADSANKDGAYVRDEARRGNAQGKLVAVFLERVTPPTGLGEVQGFDLIRWKGKRSNLFYRDLVDTLSAMLNGEVGPAPKGRLSRIRRRILAGSITSVGLTGAVLFGVNVFGVQQAVCNARAAQPAISDSCGALGLGDRPTRAERLAWDARKPGSCEDLRQHIRRFPEGRFHTEADALLASIQYIPSDRFAAADEQRPGYARQGASPASSEAAAIAGLHAAAEADARRTTCMPVDESERLLGVEIKNIVPDCRSAGGGVLCSGDYMAVCHFERQVVAEKCG